MELLLIGFTVFGLFAVTGKLHILKGILLLALAGVFFVVELALNIVFFLCGLVMTIISNVVLLPLILLHKYHK